MKKFCLTTAGAFLLASTGAWAQSAALDLPVEGVSADTVKKAREQSALVDLKPDARVKGKEKTKSVTPESAKSTTGGFIRVNRASTVLVQPGRNEAIAIAVGQPNRLITPFKNPQVVSTVLTGGRGKDCGEVCIRDAVVYITTDRTYPVTAFITEKGREDLAMSITMMPEAIPPREVRLTLPESVLDAAGQRRTIMGNAQEAQAWEQDQPYVQTIKQTFRKLALGDVPPGYSLRDVRTTDTVPVCRQSGLQIQFRHGQVLEGARMDFYVGTAKNVTDRPVEFMETHCGGWRIAAVSAYPLKLLAPGEATEVYVAVKHREVKDEQTRRRPLIERHLP